MATIDDEIAELQTKLDGLLKKRGAAQAEGPLSLADLIGTQIPTQLPIGTQLAQQFAPGGPQLNWLGGAPFKPDTRGQVLQNALSAAFGIQKELANLRKKAAAAQPAGGASAGA